MIISLGIWYLIGLYGFIKYWIRTDFHDIINLGLRYALLISFAGLVGPIWIILYKL